MTKYSIVLIKWDILNNDKIGQKLWTQNNGYNGESPILIFIYWYSCIYVKNKKLFS